MVGGWRRDVDGEVLMETVKGIEAMLTAEEVAALLKRPARFVREKLLKTGVLKGVRLGGNCWRVDPAEYRDFVARGVTGFRFARPSGGRR